MREYFVAKGWSVDCARETHEAVALLAEHDYGIAILDLRLSGTPGAEGLDLIESVRDRSPRTRIILLTAYGSREIEALRAGCAGEAEVEDREPVFVFGEERLGFRSFARAVDDPALRLEVLAHGEQDRLLVVDDQNSGRSGLRECKPAATDDPSRQTPFSERVRSSWRRHQRRVSSGSQTISVPILRFRLTARNLSASSAPRSRSA